jgi:tRNA (guanine-N7-)-methyltransferase
VNGPSSDSDGQPASDPASPGHRPIRSFVKRAGRLTPSQARALEQLWPRFGIAPPAAPLELDVLFGRHAPRTLEIGFGNGDNLAELAARHPERDYLGVEVHDPGVGHLLLRMEREGLQNIRIAHHDAVEVIERWLPPGSIDEALIFFPDPWHKKRHHKRRLVQPAFLDRLARVMAPGARLHLATDWAPYAEQMLEVCEASPHFDNTVAGGGYAPRPETRPQTKFERRGLKLGHEVFDLLYRRS